MNHRDRQQERQEDQRDGAGVQQPEEWEGNQDADQRAADEHGSKADAVRPQGHDRDGEDLQERGPEQAQQHGPSCNVSRFGHVAEGEDGGHVEGNVGGNQRFRCG